jgi:high-affinity Fe2+/Pb2+ permease
MGGNLTAMNLLPNEAIVYRTRVHRIVLIATALILLPLFDFCGFWGVFFLIGGIQEFNVGIIIGAVIYLLPPLFFVSAGIRQMGSANFMVTNKRVILNGGQGVFKHHEAEITLPEIQSIIAQPSRFA